MSQIKLSTSLHKLLTASLLLLTLASCGFTPVYAQHDNSQLAQIYINEISTREGQVLRNKLQDMLASSGNAYTLDISVTKQRRGLGIQKDFRVSRYDIILEADYKLTSNRDMQVVLQNKSKIYSSFNRTNSEFSTFVAEEDAVEKAAEELAYEIRSMLATYFSE